MKNKKEIENYFYLENFLSKINNFIENNLNDFPTFFDKNEVFSDYCKKCCPKILKPYLYKKFKSKIDNFILLGAIKRDTKNVYACYLTNKEKIFGIYMPINLLIKNLNLYKIERVNFKNENI